MILNSNENISIEQTDTNLCNGQDKNKDLEKIWIDYKKYKFIYIKLIN